MVMVRKAKIGDSEQIKKLIGFYASQGFMLARPLYEIYENIRDFFVTEINGEIVGCCATHIFGKEYKPGSKESILAEIRSLAVLEGQQRKGIGTKLVKECIEEAKKLGVTRIFVLTVKENLEFFKKVGFKKNKNMELPQKIWQECVKCPRFPSECNETPLFLDI